MAKSRNLKAVMAIFSSIYSQRIADKAGYKVIGEEFYADLVKVDPSLVFPGIEEHTKTLTVCYKIC